MTCHLATRDGVTCETPGRWLAKSGDWRDVTCKKCPQRFDQLAEGEWEAAFHRRRISVATEAAEFLGAGFVWSLVRDAEEPTASLIRDILAAVFVGLAEQHRQDVAA